jgi:hypothetical protein
MRLRRIQVCASVEDDVVSLFIINFLIFKIMAQLTDAQKSKYEKELERATLETKANGKAVKTAVQTAMRDLSQNIVTKGSAVQIPDLGENYNYKIFPGAIGGEYFIATDGEKVWLSSLTRGAKDHESKEYHKPSGSAVTEAQKFSNWQKFLSANRGKWLHFVDNEIVSALFSGHTEPTDVKVWTVELLDEKPTAEAETAE